MIDGGTILYAAVGSPPAWLLASTISANFLAGLAFGFLYQRDGLEAAMLGHALSHIVALAVGLSL
jgi:hypothetical protein